MDQKLRRGLTEAQGNRTSNWSNYVGEINFDVHMTLTLAALLCLLIGAVGVNSIVRCFLRCRYSFETERAEEDASAQGLKKQELALIPIGVYGSDANIKSTDCAICLAQFEVGDKLRMLPICNHGFHLTCIDTWLLSNFSCPNCRQSVKPPHTSPHIVVIIDSVN
ncbi:RING-H2 finger protein ATL74-like [Cucumis melo]|uniref:RING-type E3 ubiquitin transferase n=1 Tax=Cucumis melo TaxID=3656 RepID=A0A1S3B8C4_CUCME|nr:RING-H2 finger protein ATL74-like [Cucumis melo]